MCFPEFSSQNSDFSREIFVKIFSFHENLGSTFSRIPENFGRQNHQKCRSIWVSRNFRPKIQTFPGKFSPKFGIFTTFWGRPVTKFPGILVEKNPRNAEIYGFQVFLGVKIEVFPGILVDQSPGLEKMSLYPRRAPSRIYGFPGPPRRTFWTLKKTPKNLFALNGLYGGKKRPIFGRNFAKNSRKC